MEIHSATQPQRTPNTVAVTKRPGLPLGGGMVHSIQKFTTLGATSSLRQPMCVLFAPFRLSAAAVESTAVPPSSSSASMPAAPDTSSLLFGGVNGGPSVAGGCRGRSVRRAAGTALAPP